MKYNYPTVVLKSINLKFDFQCEKLCSEVDRLPWDGTNSLKRIEIISSIVNYLSICLWLDKLQVKLPLIFMKSEFRKRILKELDALEAIEQCLEEDEDQEQNKSLLRNGLWSRLIWGYQLKFWNNNVEKKKLVERGTMLGSYWDEIIEPSERQSQFVSSHGYKQDQLASLNFLKPTLF